jgi:hypothetical protein
MVTIRRWYVYLVCAVSLQAAAWAAIALGSSFVTSVSQPVAATAFQIAVIVVGLPLFLGHWLWAQRLAAAEAEPQERASAVRRLYVYGMLAAFLAPGLANLWLVLRVLFGLLLRAYHPDYMMGEGYAANESAARALVALGAGRRARRARGGSLRHGAAAVCAAVQRRGAGHQRAGRDSSAALVYAADGRFDLH